MPCPFGRMRRSVRQLMTEPQAANTRKKTPMHSAPVRRIRNDIHRRFLFAGVLLANWKLVTPLPPGLFPLIG